MLFFCTLEFLVDRGNPTEIAKATSCEFNFDPRHGSALDEICGEGAAGQAQICTFGSLGGFENLMDTWMKLIVMIHDETPVIQPGFAKLVMNILNYIVSVPSLCILYFCHILDIVSCLQ